MKWCFLSVMGCASIAVAAPVTFTVDSSRSSLTLTPTVSIFGTPLPVSRQVNPAAPSADSFVTSYSGSIVADITPATIQFLSPSSITANYDNTWSPGTDYSGYPADLEDADGYVKSSLPAAYGVITDLTALGGAVNGKQGLSPSAVRNLVLGLSDAAAKPLVGGAFNEAGTTTGLLWDHSLPEAPPLVYYASGGAPPTTRVDTVTPTATLDGIGQATLVTEGDLQTLTIPFVFSVSYPVNFLLLTNRFEGTIVATAPVPEPTMGVACLAVMALGLRRKR